jgi:two-component system OmpR family sensor kinase/two-component system phosphate regulon sensor histidine kinase PhoR
MQKSDKVYKYRQRLFYNFFLLFLLFSLVIIAIQYKREKRIRVDALEASLKTYIGLVDNYIHNNSYSELNKFCDVFPNELRITIINKNGEILYDSFVEKYKIMENHIERKEVQEALKSKYGRSIRFSNTTKLEYYYYVIRFDNYFIRAALPYNIKVENVLKADVWSIYVILLLFIVFSVVLIYLSGKLGKSISILHSFVKQTEKGTLTDTKVNFPRNELGYIAEQVISIYNNLQKTKKALSVEREKLFRHLQISHEGIAVFTKDKKQLLANNHYIQYLSIISDEPAVSTNYFLIKELSPIANFIEKNIDKKSKQDREFSSRLLKINKNGRYFVIQAIVFKDKSFEISISDVTDSEKEKQLKQQMTSNIAHELKTPVSSILGYLETILSVDIDEDKKRFFLERSYFQTERLAELIQDISLLNKIEEASDLFNKEKLIVKKVISIVIEDLKISIEEHNIEININLPDNLEVYADSSIFYSIWRNLIENTIKYAGDNVSVNISSYHDERFVYLSYSDTGVGIPEEHLSRIFERFYRVDAGRARVNGGSGLGLAIVKNGVMFHGGEISVKNSIKGGVEFLFSISK